MSNPARPRPLRVVQLLDEQGEIVGQHVELHEQSEIERLKAELADANRTIVGLETDLNAWRIRHRKLVEDRAAEAREHYLFPVVLILFKGWQVRCNHPRAKFDPSRFWAIEPFLATKRYGATLEERVVLCCRAIAGAGYNPGRKQRKNGTWQRYDDWGESIFYSAGRFEEYCNRAPSGFEPVLSPKLQEAIRVAEGRQRQIAARKAAGL
jgi:hypothetical protein